MTDDAGLVRDTGRFDLESDVVVVGGGGCGLTAAIAAAQGEVDVLVLEKQARPWCNTARSGGMVPAAGTRFQRAAGVIESPEAMAEDILRKNGRASDPETTLHLCRVAPRLVEWLVDSVGVALDFVHDFKYPAHTEFRMHAPPSRTGAALWADLRRAVAAHPRTELVEGAGATGLIADDGGAARGVVVERDGRVERIGARKVILAANGFAANRAMVARYCPEMASAYYFGGEGNTGEAIRWGQALGGAVAFMDAYQAHASVAAPARGSTSRSNITGTSVIRVAMPSRPSRDGRSSTSSTAAPGPKATSSGTSPFIPIRKTSSSRAPGTTIAPPRTT